MPLFFILIVRRQITLNVKKTQPYVCKYTEYKPKICKDNVEILKQNLKKTFLII